ncbi:hypothetical protein HPB47_021501 [Ixodes persulcatus]|uniref:Uncharacterized protein n=3 Tax=Ixodes persulcatus TaxID=34615 RepID=A0AC60Q9U7_IXOPE|nr:hypothetical protein HPB47_022408 [Ixodes persulcatus]KAG0430780.1 hypothetical protein HPB47_022376 [Ixodes persulcatus]KAG0445674.1 hypothetical protein HPB47_021501 [Ixodes persulcatus]
MDPASRVAFLVCLRAHHEGALASLNGSLASITEALTSISADVQSARREADCLEERLLANSLVIAAAIAGETTMPRSVQAYFRGERWFEDTLPNLPESHFKQAFRVMPATFRYIVDVCRPHMERQVTPMRPTISVEKRVGAALYKLCSSAEDRTVAHLFGLGRSTVNDNYKEFCHIVVSELERDWLKMMTAAELPDHVREFQAALEFPQGIAALDGCHFPVSPPKVNASDYYNYKGWYSIILLALVDHRYRFRYVNVGTPGRCHDAHVFRRSALAKILEGPTFTTPMVTINGTAVPPLVLCDQAFPLTCNMLKPYARKNVTGKSPQEKFNRQLSSARRVVENAFGRIKARFRFIMKRLECDVDNARFVIRACCTLNNICEHFNDGVESQWLTEVGTEARLYEQPVCNTDAVAGNGSSVRDSIAAYLHQH